jgi:hypothetical protein
VITGQLNRDIKDSYNIPQLQPIIPTLYMINWPIALIHLIRHVSSMTNVQESHSRIRHTSSENLRVKIENRGVDLLIKYNSVSTHSCRELQQKTDAW